MRLLHRLLLAAIVVAYLVTAGSVVTLRSLANGHLYSAADVPAAPVALVLGAKVEEDGSPSVFLTARLELARSLYAAGKVRALLVSGDHMNWGYDEPDAMRTWLVAHGVPSQRVVLDHAGFDTYDSCARAVRVFGVTRAIVVTQTFHLPRAVALCRQLGLDADGVGDSTVAQFAGPWMRGTSREYGAGVKATLDLISHRDPVFLGPHETGVEDALRS